MVMLGRLLQTRRNQKKVLVPRRWKRRPENGWVKKSRSTVLEGGGGFFGTINIKKKKVIVI